MPEGFLAAMGEESPRLSTASISSDERALSATPSDSDPPPSGRRPVSLVSTLSSGSGSSRDDSLTSPQVSEGSSGTDLNQNPSPKKKGRSFFHNKNNNNKAWTPNRASSRRQPFVGATMAPNPQLTYLDRVVMEIIETERMYVRDLRMIVEVSDGSSSIHRPSVWTGSFRTGTVAADWD
ncbi:PREDICTED: pleckstrin homology domain-containing family G member 3 [Cyprinodon variegatus]|uniref:pleckstrin homology domain-containing family G member 3 n=1 Tax=Cyprinodon variegatus TaxID=28743 RepID=UPI000742BFAD|nr:PREDICTED: pleckstrin homology domain-containing family G member 3 [Cyprinodon variegatus]